MKTQKIFIEKFKVLKNFEIDIDGKNILLIGENGLGKSTAIQFIKIALGDTNSIPPNTDGKGHIIIDKDGNKYALHVEIENGKSKIVIESQDGMKSNSKSALKSLTGAIDFNPDEFIELSKTKSGQKKQIEYFKSLLPEKVREEIAKYENNVLVAYNERTELNRDIVKLEALIKSHTLNHLLYGNELDKIKPIDITDIIQQNESAIAHNSMVDRAAAKKESNDAELKRLEKEIKKKEEELIALKESLTKAAEACHKTDKWLSENPRKETSEFETQINKAQSVNEQYKQAHDLKEKNKQLSVMVEESGDLTAKIESQREAIRQAIREMESPVDGLMFDDEQLLYRGVPVHPNSMSESEMMELSIKLKMAENPELGILFVERTESLGKKRFNELLEISDKYDWQVIGEQVERGTDKIRIEIMKRV